MIIKNCPAFVIMRTATSGTYFDMCGNAKGHTYCKDCTDCVMKKIVEKCKLQTEGVGLSGKNLAEKLLKLLDIEEVE